MKIDWDKIWGWTMAIFIIGAIVGAIIFCFAFNVELEKEADSYIGKEVVVQKDTLLVVGRTAGGYRLNNGLIIDNELLKELI